MAELLAEHVDLLQRTRLINQLNDDYARLRQDEGAWHEFQKEQADWDGVIGDGLEDDGEDRPLRSRTKTRS